MLRALKALIVAVWSSSASVNADVSVYFYNDGNDFVMDYYGSLDVTGVISQAGGPTSATDIVRIETFSDPINAQYDRFESLIGTAGSSSTYYFFPRTAIFDQPQSLSIPSIGIVRDNISITGSSGLYGFFLNGGREPDIINAHTLFLPTGYNGETFRVQARYLNSSQYFSGTGFETVAIGSQALNIYSGVAPTGLPDPATFSTSAPPNAVPEISSDGAAASLAAALALILLFYETASRRSVGVRRRSEYS